MEIRKSKVPQRSFLMWMGLLSFFGIIILATYLLTDRSEKTVLQMDENPQLAPKHQGSSPYTDPLSTEPVVPSFNPEPADSSLVSPEIAKNEDEDLWKDLVSAWGSLHTKYGDAVVNERINLISESANQAYSEISDENGYFDFGNVVPASDYQLSVSPKGMYQRVSMDSLEILDNQFVIAVVLEPLKLGTLKGRVVNAEGIAVAGYEMKVQSSSKTKWIRSFVPNIIGEFEIENVPIGPIQFTKTFGQALDISGHYFSGDSQAEIELIVDVGYDNLSGVVYDEFNNTVPGATVVLDWRHSYQGVNSVVTRRSTTSPTGKFLFQGLGKGEHEFLVTTLDGLVSHQIIDIGSDNSDMAVILQRKQLNQD